MAQPAWYKDTEDWLMSYGKWPIALLLAAIIVISLYMLFRLLVDEKPLLPAAWVTYMWMP